MVAEWWAHRTFMALARQSIQWELEAICTTLEVEELMTDAAPQSMQAVLFDPEAGDRRRTVMAALAQLEQGLPYEHALLGRFADRDHLELVMEALELWADPAARPCAARRTPHGRARRRSSAAPLPLRGGRSASPRTPPPVPQRHRLQRCWGSPTASGRRWP